VIDSTRFVPNGWARNCSIDLTLDVLADKWAFLVVREAFFGAKRFNEFGNSLQCSRATLSRTLQALQEARILETAAASSSGKWRSYSLTEAGLDLYQVFGSLMRFGDRWLCSDTPPLALFHHDCRSWLVAISVWHRTGEQVDPRTVTVVPQENYWIPSAPHARRSRRWNTTGGLSVRPDSVERTLEIIGDRWTFLILRELFHGNHKFEEFSRHIGIASNVLSERLKTLVAHLLIIKTKEARSSYRLSPIGLELYAPLMHMKQWGDKWRQESAAPPLALHPGGAPADTIDLVCATCSRIVHPRAVSYLASYQPGTPFPVNRHEL
jgi:DNA-binding HxlR family transcriptional regulator